MKKSLEWPARYAEAKARIEAATTDLERFTFLPTLAKAAFELGAIDEAEAWARESLDLATTFRNNWNYGNAIHDGHSTLGLVALRRGRRDEAAEELLLAGETPGSPQLDSFGPNMLLARELFETVERAAVLQYFELCRRFWENERGRLQSWSDDVRAERKPDFGANPLH